MEGKITLSEGLELKSVTVDSSKWQGNGNDGIIVVYTDNQYSNTTNIAKITVHVKDNANTTETIKISNIMLSVTNNYTTLKLNDIEKSVTINIKDITNNTVPEENDNSNVTENPQTGSNIKIILIILPLILILVMYYEKKLKKKDSLPNK